MKALILVLALLGCAVGKVYFKETFDDTWESRWTVSDWKKADGTQGAWKVTAGKWYDDAERDKGLQTSEDYRFYAITAPLAEDFDNKDKDLVIQYQVKHEQKIDCGGAYIKLLPASTDQKTFSGDSDYHIMFGPDICGTGTRKVHAIFNYDGKNHLWKKDQRCETDQLSHLYTLVVKPDNTYEVYTDQKKVQSGSLEEDWDMLKPKKIKDPEAKKPDDWVDAKEIDDPDDKKPDGYDDIPAQIADPDATKPDDWNDDEDGEWEAPMIDNPEYKGAWKPKKIPNPAYKGEWVHPMIDNPDYKEDPELYRYKDSKYVGFELWQVKAGTIFDNIIVTDSYDEAEAFANETWKKMKDGEKSMFDEAEKERRAKEEEERKQREEERKKREEERKKDEEEAEDDEEDDLPKKDEL